MVPQLAPPASIAETESASRKLHSSDAAVKHPITPNRQNDELTGAGSTDVMRILQCLKAADKLHVDSIIEGSGLTVATVLKLLLELELKGVVTQHPGKIFSLSST